METKFITHIHAALAITLAYRLRGAHPDRITRELHDSGCPRELFILASVLQAAERQGAIVEKSRHD